MVDGLGGALLEGVRLAAYSRLKLESCGVREAADCRRSGSQHPARRALTRSASGGSGIAKHSGLYKAERDQLMLVRWIAAQRRMPCPFSKL